MDILVKVLTTTTPAEWAANIMTAICIFLAGRNNVHTWWTGIVATALFGVLFYQYKLYADVTLQVFFVATSVIGWWGWVHTKTKPALDVTYASTRSILIMLLVAAIVYAAYTKVLIAYTDAAAPFADTAVLVLSVVGQLLLMRRSVQSWPVWLAVNTIAVPLFFSRELYLTSFMYALFWVNAVVSWWYWFKLEYETSKGVYAS